MEPEASALVEAIENAFNLKFSPGEITDDSYLEDLYAALRLHITQDESDKCFASIVFWRLRRSWMDLFDVPKAAITPSASIARLLPSFRRRRTWRALSKATGLSLPGLEYGWFLSSVIFCGALCISLAALFFAFRAWGATWWASALPILLMGILLWPFLTCILYWLLKPFATALPRQTQTFGDLAKTVVGLNYGKLAAELGKSRDAELLDAARRVMADLLDGDPRMLVGENPRLDDLALSTDGFRAQV